MKKVLLLGLVLFISTTIFARDMQYYYQFENRSALSIGTGYDLYNMREKDSAGEYQDLFKLYGMTLNFKAEMPLRSLAGISLFLDTNLMLPSTSTLNTQSDVALEDSTHLQTLASNNTGSSNYILIDNNIGLNMLGTITPSMFVYIGTGLDVLIGHSSYKYNDGSSDQTLLYGYLGLGIFQTVGLYFEVTDNIAFNIGGNITYDFLVYNYQKDSSDSSSDKFDKLDARGSNYFAKVMFMYNF